MPARSAAALLVVALAASAGGCSSDCNAVDVGIGAACLPGVASSEALIFIEVREACGTSCAGAPTCSAVLLDGAVQLQLEEDHCTSLFVNCPAQPCQERVVSCKIPGLLAGDYPVLVPGSQSRLLRVRDSGGTSACRLPVATP